MSKGPGTTLHYLETSHPGLLVYIFSKKPVKTTRNSKSWYPTYLTFVKGNKESGEGCLKGEKDIRWESHFKGYYSE